MIDVLLFQLPQKIALGEFAGADDEHSFLNKSLSKKGKGQRT